MTGRIWVIIEAFGSFERGRSVKRRAPVDLSTFLSYVPISTQIAEAGDGPGDGPGVGSPDLRY